MGINSSFESLSLERDLLLDMARGGRDQEFEDRAAWQRLVVTAGALSLDDPRKAEESLDAMSMHIRGLLLRGHVSETSHLRSADLRVDRQLPSSGKLLQAYERSVESRTIEHQFTLPQVHPQWRGETLTFSSGMAALSCVLTGIRFMSARPDSSLRVATWASYFETDALLQLELGHGAIHKLDDLRNAASVLRMTDPDALLVESVRYDWHLEPLYMPALVRALAEMQRRPRFLIVDKTLSPTWPTNGLLGALLQIPDPPIVIEVRSGLKLDQQGLEVANLGIVDIFASNGGSTPAAAVADVLRLIRTTHGSGLGRKALMSLDVPFITDHRWRSLHSRSVMANNARLADLLSDLAGGVIQNVVHPSLSTTGGHAPFVIMRLGTDRISDHALFLAAMRELLKPERGLVVHGSSFGFRGTRYETIIPHLSEETGLFKVAAGSRGGPSTDALRLALYQLSRYRDFTELRCAMPTLKEVPLT